MLLLARGEAPVSIPHLSVHPSVHPSASSHPSTPCPPSTPFIPSTPSTPLPFPPLHSFHSLHPLHSITPCISFPLLLPADFPPRRSRTSISARTSTSRPPNPSECRPSVRPMRAVRIHRTENPRSRNVGTSLCLGEIHPSAIRVASGRDPEFITFADSSFADWAYRTAKSQAKSPFVALSRTSLTHLLVGCVG